jgi:hypothetical protein
MGPTSNIRTARIARKDRKAGGLQTNKQTTKQTNNQTIKQTDKQISKQTIKQTDKQTNNQTQKQRERKKTRTNKPPLMLPRQRGGIEPLRVSTPLGVEVQSEHQPDSPWLPAVTPA